MKGIIFNVVEDAITAEHGEAVWDSLLEAAGLEGAFTALGNYPDEDLTALVEAGAEALDVPPAELTRTLGHAALLGLAERYPQFFATHTSSRSFLLTLNDVIHPEVRKLHADAQPPDFWFDEGENGRLVVHYRSRRMLCALAEGMIMGAAAHYGEVAQVHQDSCMLDGADHCVLHVMFAAAG